MLKINKIYNMDCLEGLKKLDDNIVDLIVTSPPYDNLRDYTGEAEWNFEVFKPIAKEMFRVIKKGGVVVWVIGDATINGNETGSSFKQALYFKELGFNLHDTMIYEKNSSTFPARKNGIRYTQIFEYMFIFSKEKPKTYNLICDKKNKWAGYKDYSKKLKNPVPYYSPRNNIFKYITSKNSTIHTAPFPLSLAKDHIISWSNKKDLVLDPFIGSGTTAVACKELRRNYIGFEISKKYCDIAKARIEDVVVQDKLFKGE